MFTWKNSANTPSFAPKNLKLPINLWSWALLALRIWVPGAPQSGVQQGTTTLSPGLKFFTAPPTSTTSPTASWPRIKFLPGWLKVCIKWVSEEQGAKAMGRTMASRGPAAGFSRSIQPCWPAAVTA